MLAYPIMLVFMSTTQGISLTYFEIFILSGVTTLASIGASPIPSSSVVVLIFLMDVLSIPVTPMYSYLVATEWIMDRIITVANVLGDLFAADIAANFYF
jgi:Na+/H+-dicarboxylate symporter